MSRDLIVYPGVTVPVTLIEFLVGLENRGFQFRGDGETLKVTPPAGESLSIDERARLKAAKLHILTLLTLPDPYAQKG